MYNITAPLASVNSIELLAPCSFWAASRNADEHSVAASFINLAYKMGTKNLPEGVTTKAFTRQQLDRLKIGAGVKAIPWGAMQISLPPSTLPVQN
ncbi:hypothetical protein LARV_03816 [Longilinea arvoryzae]|uniref:Uncharacterized protein n=1 Tax=Longilinea arvoryzae TaxID=360412 RepID=A0A0K8MYA8_9CHLR|nr:hypothetical protein [Longilinea arvoryzae]GAP16021.1 hypothetical protein LARV_03816 [Longilinea arvoryzae]